MSRIQEAAIEDRAAVEVVDESQLVPPPCQVRAGERALSLLATPLNLSILRALSERPMRLGELRRAAGLPAQTTLRGHLAMLTEIGALTRHEASRAPHAVENELTPMGDELLDLAGMLEIWLRRAPDGPIALDSRAAKGVVKAFVDGWSSTVMQGLAARPTSLTELDREIAALSYPALERRMSSMRMANLIEALPSEGAGTPYAVTDWAREGVVPLAVASRCERLHMRDRATPVDQADIEAAFMLAMPLARLGEEDSGTCQLRVEAAPRGLRGEAAVEVALRGGVVTACEPGVRDGTDALVAGSTRAWYVAIREGDLGPLGFDGDGGLGERLVRGLRSALSRC
jgi:DNA-binding HxlR family transcriptional regulator